VAFVGIDEIGQLVDELWPKKRISRWQPQPWPIFGHVTVTGFNIWCRVPNFIKIGQFFIKIWRFYDFQNGGRPPCWILKICSFCHVALVNLPFCFLIQNFPEIGQSVNDLWPKKAILKRWRPPPCWILKISIFGHVTVVYQISSKSDNVSLRYGDFTIFKMAAVRHVGF